MITKRRKRKFNTTFFKKWASYRLYRKRPPCIVNWAVPKIIAISVHTVNRFPLTKQSAKTKQKWKSSYSNKQACKVLRHPHLKGRRNWTYKLSVDIFYGKKGYNSIKKTSNKTATLAVPKCLINMYFYPVSWFDSSISTFLTSFM